MKTISFFRMMIGVMLTCLALLMGSTRALASYEYQVLQSLGKPEGTPRGKLVQGSDGNFYGTTYYGGSQGAGTVFKISSTGDFTILHEFDGADDGANPQAGLIQASDGYFYGTTVNGGGSDAGIVFKIDSSGNFSILHELDGANDGAHPNASLIQANDGNFYGTTESGAIFKMSPSGSFNILYQYGSVNGVIQGSDGNLYGTSHNGGSSDAGTAFKLDLSGNLTVLYEFGDDGYYPVGSLIQATDGSFYGLTWAYAYVYPISTFFKIDSSGNYTHLTTIAGQSQGGLIQASDGNFYITSGIFDRTNRNAVNFGWVTKIDASGSATILYSFMGGSGGANPYAALVQGRDSRLYGTTEEGGNGSGTVFQLDLAGNFQVLHDFDGPVLSSPTSLVQGSDGSLYGTAYGGSYNIFGAVFKMDTAGNLSVLHSFNGSSDGAFPVGLMVGGDGSLYGATSGGMLNYYYDYAPSTIYKIDPDGNFSILLSYDVSTYGYGIYSDIIEATDGFFYGTFVGGGDNEYGSVFKLDPATGSLSVLHDFDVTGGIYPWGGVIQGADGNFYGTTHDGGSYGAGNVYRLDQSGNFSVLHEFDRAGGGASPDHGVLQGSDGNLYGSSVYYYSNSVEKVGIFRKCRPGILNG